jgi:hypothetical protein
VGGGQDKRLVKELEERLDEAIRGDGKLAHGAFIKLDTRSPKVVAYALSEQLCNLLDLTCMCVCDVCVRLRVRCVCVCVRVCVCGRTWCCTILRTSR